MTGERWKRVNEIFHGALDVASGDREGFVARAAEGDGGLEAEVRDLLAADDAAEGYFEAPVVVETVMVSPFQPGDTLCDRFRIVRAVGEGGMGFVFEAYDVELAVTVALKVIHPAIAAQAGALARFQQEVRLARRITHPNVCRTFDIDREVKVVDDSGMRRETVFLTMEFLEGETLGARLKRRGRMELDEALAVATQVASALDAAHALGIVHRDIKPANVVLVPGGAGRAVVMDFGLARLDSRVEGGSLSHGNQLVGTLAYMAPEQMEGGAVSAATDVYAFGLVLFEMVTGERAFPSESLLSGIWQRMAGNTPSAKERVPGLPPEWERAIQGCLLREPGERFQRAAEVVAVLGGGRAALRGGKRWAKAWGWARHRRGLRSAGVMFVGMALFAGGVRLRRSRGESRVATGALVYLAPVKNDTGEKPLDNLTELVREGLAQSVQINLLDPVRAGGYLQQMKRPEGGAEDAATAREVALRAGASRVILFTLTGSGGNYRLETAIEQPDATPLRARGHWERSVAWHGAAGMQTSRSLPPELLGAIRAGSDWIRATVGESAHDIARLDAPPEDVTTGDWQALMDFDQAQRSLRVGRKDEAIGLLNDAVRRDPGFARAYATLADNLMSDGRFSEGYQAYLKALNNDSGERLSRKERDFIKATFAVDTRDYTAAVEAFQDYTAFYENDFYAWAYQGYPLEELDRPLDALRVLEKADRLTPGHDAAGQMVYPYLLLGDGAGARRAIAEARAGGHREQAVYLDGVEALCAGEYVRAEASFEGLRRAENAGYLILGRMMATRLLAEQGRYMDALGEATEGMAAVAGVAGPEGKAQQLLDGAWLKFRVSRGADALTDVEAALALRSGPSVVLNGSTILGGAMPRLRGVERRRAQDLLRRMARESAREQAGVVFALARARVQGETMLAQGKTTEALAAFRAADRLDGPLAPREYLARGLMMAAKQESDPHHAATLRREALAAYGRVALRPATVWVDASSLPPGSVADQMAAYLALAHELHQTNEDVSRVAGSLAALRHNGTIASLR